MLVSATTNKQETLLNILIYTYKTITAVFSIQVLLILSEDAAVIQNEVRHIEIQIQFLSWDVIYISLRLFLFAPAGRVLINPEFFDISSHLQDPHCYQLKLIYLSQIPFSLSCQLALPEPTPTIRQKEPLFYVAHGKKKRKRKKKGGKSVINLIICLLTMITCWTLNKLQKQYPPSLWRRNHTAADVDNYIEENPYEIIKRGSFTESHRPKYHVCILIIRMDMTSSKLLLHGISQLLKDLMAHYQVPEDVKYRIKSL